MTDAFWALETLSERSTTIRSNLIKENHKAKRVNDSDNSAVVSASDFVGANDDKSILRLLLIIVGKKRVPRSPGMWTSNIWTNEES